VHNSFMTALETSKSEEPSGEAASCCGAAAARPGRWRQRLPGGKGQLIFWGVLLAGLAVDLWSKQVVFERIEYGQEVSVIDGFLRLIPAVNNGAAFGICAGQPFFLAAASVVALVLVSGYFLFSGAKQVLIQVALGLLAAGICGNLYDRLFHGGFVRDFIDVFVVVRGRELHWHTFNVADALLCIGVALMIIWTGTTGKSAQGHARRPK